MHVAGLQIASFLFVLIIFINYIGHPRLKLLSSVAFSAYITCALFSTLFELLTIFTINNMDIVSSFLNRSIHNLFLISMLSTIFSLFLYILLLDRNQKRIEIRYLILCFAPYILGVILVIKGKLYYVVNDKGFYSEGPAAKSIYICLIVYISMSFYYTYKSVTIDKGIKRSVYFSLMIYPIAGIIQFINHYNRVSAASIALMTLFMFLSFVNPNSLLDDNNNFNSKAFDIMLTEYMESKKGFYIFTIVIDNISELNNRYGYENVGKVFSIMNDKVWGVTYGGIYRPRRKILCMMVKIRKHKPNQLSSILDEIKMKLDTEYKVGDYVIVPSYRVMAMECPKYAETKEDIYNFFSYLSNDISKNEFADIEVVDEKFVDGINRVERIRAIINDAIINDGFEMYYQPIFSTKDKTFSSAEALIRLKHTTELGYISPEEFIPIAENSGYIRKIGDIVFNKVCKFAKNASLSDMGVHYIEVNLSGIQCVDLELPKQLRRIMAENEISPEFINLEITETASVNSGENLIQNIETLKSMGCSFSMDDFGTGFSNLSQMVDFNYDLIKLDKSLIWPCFEMNGVKPSEKAVVILKSTVMMILGLSMKIVAEGVETKEQADTLTELGVDYLQGYYYSRPISEVDYMSFMLENR